VIRDGLVPNRDRAIFYVSKKRSSMENNVNNIVPVLKPDDYLPVPSAWRNTICRIVEALKEGDFDPARSIPGVLPMSESDAEFIAESIAGYSEELTSLPEEAWATSVYVWYEGFWEVMVDLYTVGEGRSDMVLKLHVREDGDAYAFDVLSVFVP
jgi:hypothetical protein